MHSSPRQPEGHSESHFLAFFSVSSVPSVVTFCWFRVFLYIHSTPWHSLTLSCSRFAKPTVSATQFSGFQFQTRYLH
jgi:hypothetical protein